MATLTELRDAVREELQETGVTTGLWSNDELDRWFQEANDDITRQARIEAAPYALATVADTESYALPDDLGSLRRVELKVDTASWLVLAPVRVDQRIPQNTSGIPSHKGSPAGYFIWNDRLYLTPVPDGVYELVLWYTKKGNTLSAAVEPIIPDEFHWILKLYVAARAKRKIDDPAYTTYASDYQAAVSDMRSKLARYRRPGGRFKQVLDTGR